MKHNYLSPLYNELKRKFFLFSARLQKSINSGKFWKLSKKERNSLVQRVEKLRQRLAAINPKHAIAGAALFLGASGAMAQPFTQQTGTNNPANVVTVVNSGYSAPVFGDLDNDGDMDMIVGDYNNMQYFLNTGTATAPVFTAQTGTSNPLGVLGIGSYAYYLVPALGDIDGDGDLDVFMGADGDTMFYYKNTGTASSAAFTLMTGTNNILPDFPSADYLDEVAPSFVDIDNDGDLDVMVGEEDHTAIYMLRNTGTPTAPVLVYESSTSLNNPFAALNPTMSGYRTEPGFGDVDADGDYDALVGHGGSANQYFKNTGTAAVPVFTEMTGTDNPFVAITPNGYFYSAFVDIDGDTDMDMFVGSGTEIQYYKNVNPTTEISENVLEGFSMYPNPANSILNINLEGKYSVRITDLTGKVVMQQNLSEKTINVESLKAGVYMVEVTQDGNKAVRSLVKE
jgi:hypothetical protein